ncbi:hypothetical protein FKX85_09505 [Echinicola soli]|uniref:Uncharacterized protein n=1 Tax=Echinicola soli TaxID=2591634 RepID=A0A514CHY8_9BACT|nr:hypothetical protein [Echinicola soli]QDH79254.1 hypothetical protein FKX85_09505 [Echinicola soli]
MVIFSFLWDMSIKNGFIAAIAVFLLFILFKSSIKSDQAQIIFAVAFVVLEIAIIAAVALKKKWKG